MSETTALASEHRGARQYAWLVLALGIGAFCRFWDLTGPSLFVDEGFVFHISEHSTRDIAQLVAYTDFHPPLFYLITHYLMVNFHLQQWNYRYLTAAFSMLGIAATWAITRRCFGEMAASIAALALALEPALIEWDRVYRMYAVLAALGSISWWLLLRAGDPATQRRWVWWVMYGVAAVALPYVHYVGALVVLSQGLYALTRLPRLWPALVGDCCAALALLPWVWAIRVQYPHGGLVIGIDSPDFSWPRVVRSMLAGGLPANWVLNPHFDPLFATVAVAIAIGGIYIGRKSMLPYWFFPIIIQVIGSLATGKDLVIPRYLNVYIPAFCMCFALVAATWLQSKYRLAAVAMLTVYAAVSIVSIKNQLFVPFYQFPNWYEVNVLLLQHEQRHDLIVMDQGAEYWVVYKFTGFRNHQMDAPAIPSDVPKSIRWLRGYPLRRVWYIENQPHFTDSQRRIEHDLDKTRPRLGAWRQSRLFTEDVVRIELYGPRFEPALRSKSVVKSSSL